MERLRVQKAAFAVYVLMLVSGAWAANGTTPNVATDPVGIATKFGCWIVGILSSPALVAVAGAVVLLIFGWGKLAGEMNAFQNFKNSTIGAIIVLSAAAISGALFGAACSVNAGP